ncbi:MAG TPA: hypothetical protein V6C65_26290 [Allocoleopsis sp.]
MKVTKDGNEIFEIADTPEEQKIAAAKGYVPVVEVSKDGINWHNIKGTEDEITLAIGKGYKTKQPKTSDQYSKTESALRGGAAGFTFDFDDELGGAAGALMGKGSYEEVRDRIRQQKNEAQEQNPWSYGLGEFAGSAVLPVGAGAGAKTVLGAVGKGMAAGALQGGLSGVGRSNAEAWQENALDGAEGAMWGAALGGVLGGASNVVTRGAKGAAEGFKKSDGFLDTAKETAKGIWTGGDNSLQSEMQAFKRGMKNAEPMFDGTPVLETGERWLQGIKETVKSAGAMEDFKKFIKQSKAAVVSRMVPEGGDEDGLRAARSMMDKMSDDEFILRQLSEEGDNEVKRWVAKNAASLGGQIDSDEYNKVLSLGTDARNEARDFAADKRSYAKELAPVVADTNTKMKGAIKDRVSQLSGEAAERFDGDIKNLETDILAALKDSTSMSSIPKSIKKRLLDASELMTDGKAPSSYGLSNRPYWEIDNVEQFRRLQKFRETLDLGIDWDAIKTGKRSMNEGEAILADLRGKVDGVLKATPGKTQADEVYRLGKEIRDAVFKKTELKGGVDSGKLNRLFSNTDEGIRFRDSLENLREWATDPQYAPEAREAAQELLKRFDSLYKIADNAKMIGGFRMKQGPSSPAIERMQSVLNKNTLVQDAVLNPSNFVNSSDQFMKNFAKDIAGKSFKEMNETEKSAFIKLWQWHSKEVKDGMVTPEAIIKENFQKFLKVSGKK